MMEVVADSIRVNSMRFYVYDVRNRGMTGCLMCYWCPTNGYKEIRNITGKACLVWKCYYANCCICCR